MVNVGAVILDAGCLHLLSFRKTVCLSNYSTIELSGSTLCPFVTLGLVVQNLSSKPGFECP